MLSIVAYLDSGLRWRAILNCIVYHYLTNNTRYFRSRAHSIIKVIQLFKTTDLIFQLLIETDIIIVIPDLKYPGKEVLHVAL